MTLDRHVYSLWHSRELYGTFILSVLSYFPIESNVLLFDSLEAIAK